MTQNRYISLIRIVFLALLTTLFMCSCTITLTDEDPCEQERILYEKELKEFRSKVDKPDKYELGRMKKSYYKALIELGCPIPIN